MFRLQVSVGAGKLELDKRYLRGVFRSAGNEIAALTRSMIRHAAGGGRKYWLGPGHTYQASAPGQPPVSRTGRLDSHIVVRPFKNGEGVAIRETTFYALFLAKGAHGGGGNTQDRRNILLAGETDARGRVLRGRNRLKASAISRTRVLLPRPSLELALEQREASIEARVKEAIMQGLKFKRLGVRAKV